MTIDYPSAFVHPGLVLTKADIAYMRLQLANEPWERMYTRLRNSPRTQLTVTQ